jgi:hydroxymethylpyrimidine/phosphomethylpyrimidine kinase
MSILTPILSITGSDNTGEAGVQSDIKTITDLGGEALTAVTAVTVQDNNGIQTILDLPQDVVIGQVKAVVHDSRPRAVKVGMIRDAATVCALRDEIIGCNNIVVALSILTSRGECILSDETLLAYREKLIPEATLLLLRCQEAEILLGKEINTDDDMLEAAKTLTEMGTKSVLLRGGHQMKDRVSALLFSEGTQRFFSSENTVGWQKHGVGGAYSTAIATRLAMGDNLDDAINKAHDYIHGRLLYAVERDFSSRRPAEIYNQFMSLVAEHYREAHDVFFYADRLAITTRYLSQVTAKMAAKTPKQIIADYLLHESHLLLLSSNKTISEIAYMLGFSSQSIFCRFFSQREGCSPANYRNGTRSL